MKHLHTLLMTVLLSTSASAAEAVPSADAPEARRTILGVLINPSQWSLLTLQGERVMGPRVSVGLGVMAGVLRSAGDVETSNTSGPTMESRSDASLVGIAPLARFFLTGTAPEGLWLSPQLGVYRSWGNSSTQGSPESGWENQQESRTWGFSGTALVGYTTVVGQGLAVQVGAGVETRYEHTRSLSLFRPTPGSGEVSNESWGRSRGWSVRERLALSLGWAF